jgi:hypothetical protein
MRKKKFRSDVNWHGALKQNGIKQWLGVNPRVTTPVNSMLKRNSQYNTSSQDFLLKKLLFSLIN